MGNGEYAWQQSSQVFILQTDAVEAAAEWLRVCAVNNVYPAVRLCVVKKSREVS